MHAVGMTGRGQQRRLLQPGLFIGLLFILVTTCVVSITNHLYFSSSSLTLTESTVTSSHSSTASSSPHRSSRVRYQQQPLDDDDDDVDDDDESPLQLQQLLKVAMDDAESPSHSTTSEPESVTATESGSESESKSESDSSSETDPVRERLPYPLSAPQSPQMTQVHECGLATPLWQKVVDDKAPTAALLFVARQHQRFRIYGVDSHSEPLIRRILQPYKHLIGREVLPHFDDQFHVTSDAFDASKCDTIETRITFILSPWHIDNNYHLQNDNLFPLLSNMRDAGVFASPSASWSSSIPRVLLLFDGDRSRAEYTRPLWHMLEHTLFPPPHSSVFSLSELDRDPARLHCFTQLRWGRGPLSFYLQHSLPHSLLPLNPVIQSAFKLSRDNASLSLINSQTTTTNLPSASLVRYAGAGIDFQLYLRHFYNLTSSLHYRQRLQQQERQLLRQLHRVSVEYVPTSITNVSPLQLNRLFFDTLPHYDQTDAAAIKIPTAPLHASSFRARSPACFTLRELFTSRALLPSLALPSWLPSSKSSLSLRSSLSSSVVRAPVIVYVTRGGHPSEFPRVLLNRHFLYHAFHQLGVKLLFCCSWSASSSSSSSSYAIDSFPSSSSEYVPSVVRYFSDVDIVIGLHGAGLAHMIFMPHTVSLVVELKTKFGYDVTVFEEMASYFALHYRTFDIRDRHTEQGYNITQEWATHAATQVLDWWNDVQRQLQQ